ncbi:uncharacterized protein Z520_01244 [Fonsecaea multimorphosa CBS 102226]|uniref:Uncharacterized protein n=1 Tax=Fonsecaea multimorphosa CBS 102226 TaxID=1442371 RepID=A0A0D2L162_9EURO|nr:uncharacterized protein Z520_01244 [Fonsecaea multimorphosa CBS 102226]KIY02779.1 hypothetical protein Z520_01244 [Fonsecaea multimorphosa CBS 102226]OAL31203.1 hypothetical protein AYO22_01236 [Fonsecaea multimorphosa]
MGVQDFIRFDLDEYRAKVRNYDDQELQKKEVVLIRTAYSGQAGIVSGAIMAPSTGGASMLGCVAAGRTIHLVEQKLEVVRAELTRRGLPLHEKRTRDHAIPVTTGSIAGAMGLASGMEGHILGTAAAAGANLVAVTTEKLDRVQTAPVRPGPQEANSFQRLKRSVTETATSRSRSLLHPFSSEDKLLFQQYDELVARKKSLEERYQRLREATLAAAGAKWYWYVVYHYPCASESLIISTHSGLWIESLRRRDSLGQWDKTIQRCHRRWAKDGLERFQKDLDETKKRLDEWNVLVVKSLPPGPISAPDATSEMLVTLNRSITICLLPLVGYWILRLSWFGLAYRLLVIVLLGFGVHARILWDYEMYPLIPIRVAKT